MARRGGEREGTLSVLEDGAAFGHRPLILASMMLATFMAAVEGTIVATAMPSIVADLGGFRLFSWVFAAFFLTQAVTTPIYGRLADLYGRKPVFYVGTSLFLVGSLLAGFASSMVQLIAMRALQGLGAGAVQPIANTVVGDIYTPQERARIQGFMSAVWGTSAVIGPVLGAFIVTHLSWSLVFWINLPIGIASMLMLHTFLRESLPRRQHRIDFIGAVLLVVGVAALMLAMIQGASLSSAQIAVLVVAGAVCLGLFLMYERRAPEPMVPPALWRNRVILVGNLGALTAGALMMGIVSFLPTYMQGVMGASAIAAGFALAAMSMGWPLSSIAGGRLMLRTSYRFTATLGGGGLILGSAVLAALSPAHGLAWAVAGSFFTGCGMGFCMITFLVSIQSTTAWAQRGIATSSNMFMRILGQAMGTALFGAVLNYGMRGVPGGGESAVTKLIDPVRRAALSDAVQAALVHAMENAMQHVYLVAVGLAVVTLLLVRRLPDGLRPAAGD